MPLQDGNTALMLAAMNGHLEVVRVLTEGGAAIDTQDEVGCPTKFDCCFLNKYIYIYNDNVQFLFHD